MEIPVIKCDLCGKRTDKRHYPYPRPCIRELTIERRVPVGHREVNEKQKLHIDLCLECSTKILKSIMSIPFSSLKNKEKNKIGTITIDNLCSKFFHGYDGCNLELNGKNKFGVSND